MNGGSSASPLRQARGRQLRSGTSLKTRARELVLSWRRTFLCCVLVHGPLLTSAEANSAGKDSDFLWVSLPVAVNGFPGNTEPVPVSCAVDFSTLLDKVKLGGIADERSIRLKFQSRHGKKIDVPVQFTPKLNQRLRSATLLPGTQKEVSYRAEFAAGHPPGEARVAGTLTWFAQGRHEYRLEFGILKSGKEVQVPYPPYNFRGFRPDGDSAQLHWFPRMQIRPQQALQGKLDVLQDNELVTSYYTGPILSDGKAGNLMYRRPFLYPVNGPDGVSLTSFGKPHDPTGSHAHHYSFWVAHANVDGLDFWSERGEGIIFHDGFAEVADGPVFCKLAQNTLWRAGDKDLVKETRKLTFFISNANYRLIDVDLELSPAGDTPITFGRTSFGFLAARVAPSLSPFDGGGRIVNSRGDRNEEQAHLKSAHWIDLSGPVAQSKWGGLAMMDHPENVNHPTTWHCRNDGWAGASFSYGRDWHLEARSTIRLRYRLVLHAGDASKAQISKRYLEYVMPLEVKLGEPRVKSSRFPGSRFSK